VTLAVQPARVTTSFPDAPLIPKYQSPRGEADALLSIPSFFPFLATGRPVTPMAHLCSDADTPDCVLSVTPILLLVPKIAPLLPTLVPLYPNMYAILFCPVLILFAFSYLSASGLMAAPDLDSRPSSLTGTCPRLFPFPLHSTPEKDFSALSAP